MGATRLTSATMSIALFGTLYGSADPGTTYSTYLGRRFSDFDLLVFSFGTSGEGSRSTIVINSITFKQKGIFTTVVHGSSAVSASSYNVSGITVSYVSETQFKVMLSGAKLIYCTEIVGVKP